MDIDSRGGHGKYTFYILPTLSFPIFNKILEIKTNNGEVKEQIVSVEGYIYDINHINNRNTILLSSELGENATVICDMQKNQRTLLTNLNKGELVTIKGIYKGSLNDVILLNCILSNEPSNE